MRDRLRDERVRPILLPELPTLLLLEGVKGRVTFGRSRGDPDLHGRGFLQLIEEAPSLGALLGAGHLGVKHVEIT